MQRSLLLSRSVVAAKLANQRTFLRRNGAVGEQVLEAMKRCIEACSACVDLDSLHGFEGMGAMIYFEHFPTLLQGELVQTMKGRQRRPPKDPINAMLSFTYTLLLRDMVSACAAVGFDPMIGFFHYVVDLVDLSRPSHRFAKRFRMRGFCGAPEARACHCSPCTSNASGSSCRTFFSPCHGYYL